MPIRTYSPEKFIDKKQVKGGGRGGVLTLNLLNKLVMFIPRSLRYIL